MAMLVHITAEPRLKAILRNGIAPTRWKPDPQAHPDVDRVVWTFPLVASHTLTHAWARELKRHGVRTLAAVTVRVPDGEAVFVRHYTQPVYATTLAQAVAVVRGLDDPRGFEILVPRRIKPSEVVRARVLGKVFGWRYAPHLKGSPPMLCDCPACLPRNEVNAAADRRRLWTRLAAAGRTPDSDDGRRFVARTGLRRTR